MYLLSSSVISRIMYEYDKNRQELVPKLTHHDNSEKQNYEPNTLKWIHPAKINKACYNAILIKIEKTVVESK